MSGYIDRIKGLETDDIWRELEGDEPCKDTSVYSSSRMSDCDCLWRYKLQYVDGFEPKSRNFSASVGSTLHAAIAKIHIEKKPKDWYDIFTEQWEETVHNSDDANLPWSNELSDKEYTSAREDASVVLDNYVRRNGHVDVVGVEMPFFMVLQHPRTKTKYRFTGTVDQIRNTSDGGLWIPDLKYWKTTPGEDYLRAAKAPTTYGLALKDGVFITNDGDHRRFGEYPERLSWYLLRNLLPYKRKTTKGGMVFQKGDMRGDPNLEILRDPAEYGDRKSEMFRLIQIIRMGLFVRQEAPTKCTMCRMSHVCTAQHQGFDDAFSLSDEEV